MKFLLQNKIPVIISPFFCGCVARVFSNGEKVNGVVIFPFLIIREQSLLENTRFIRHETIHYRQLVETAVLGSFLLSMIKWIYAKLILRKTNIDAYFYLASEQEAHRNDLDESYLENRRPFSLFKYVSAKNKREIKFIEGVKTILE